MRLKLFLSFALIVLVSVILVAFIARLGVAREVRTFMFGGGMTGSSGLVSALERYYQVNTSWEGVESVLVARGHGMMGEGGQGHGQGTLNQRLRVVDANGVVVADTGGTNLGVSLTRLELRSAISLNVGRKVVGYLLVESGTGFTLSDEVFLIGRLNRAALLAGLVAGGLALLLALLLAYGLLRPVRELTSAAHRLAQGDLSQRVPVRGDDELAELGRTFNQMAASLQAAEESRRAMTADIAHELRTPIAVQRANLEALQDGVYPPTPDNLQPILEQNLLLTRLVDDLRTLALADAGQLTLERQPVDFPPLIQRILDRFQPQASAQDVSLVFTSPPDSWPPLNLDPQRIEQILTNLLSNALRYTPAGGQISLALRRTSQGIELAVCDSGPGIPADALEHVFERFYRADKSRARLEGGSGLGLAIARQLARAHGGDLTAANHPAGGAVFTLSLPLS
jgi:signal transduction histidine kinase